MLLGFLVMTAVAAIVMRDLFAVVMLFGIYSFLTAALFMALDAPDVAFTEAAVGAGVTTVLLLSSLRLTGRWERRPKHGPLVPLLVVGVTGAALIYGTLDIPLLGDPAAPAHQHVAPRYVQQTAAEMGIPNMVTAVLASYRGFDTLGETLVIFTAGLGVLLLLGVREGPETRPGHSAIGSQPVLRLVVKMLIPFILLFALYVQLHGDYGAGGGFQAGIILATALVLYALVFGEDLARQVAPPFWLLRLAAVGILLYGGVGLFALLNGRSFLDYAALDADPVAGRHMGILLVELGIGVCVFAVVLSIFYALSGRRPPP